MLFTVLIFSIVWLIFNEYFNQNLRRLLQDVEDCEEIVFALISVVSHV